jgi:two-component system chemotaxis sensor kinase CheA
VTTTIEVFDLNEDLDINVESPERAPIGQKEEKQETDKQNIQKEIEEASKRFKETKVKEVKPKAKARDNNVSSILRVESKRIDNLLNLVSEAVINKATFNQISSQFIDLQIELNTAELSYKEKLKNLFEELPQYLSNLKENQSAKDIKKDINEKYSDLFNSFDSFGSGFKTTLATFKNTAANLGRNTGDLHEGILRIRMVPINQIFSRFPRLVRDLCHSLEKKVDLVIEGEDTELDKSVTEQLLDPLMHCVRNSIDHGVEQPEVRRKHGKKETGKLLLKASNEGNMIVIDIADDGAGINVENVRNKAVANGIIHPSKSLSDLEAYNLIFEPGFSTAKDVTNISGRGVGLDVVKKEIEKLNGSVNVWSSPGHGTRFTIKLPLTLAIIQGLLVKVGQEIYAIPITSVIESHRIKPNEINIIDNYEVFNVRNDVVSLIRLNTLFRIESQNNKEYLFVVIVGSGDKKMGLVVDSLIGEEEVVIKPLKDKYTNSPGIAGATILGDGTVSLIIDVSQLLDLGVKRAQETRRESSINFS